MSFPCPTTATHVLLMQDAAIALINRRMHEASQRFEEQLMFDLYSAPPPKRLGRLRLVSGLEMLQLGIPHAAMRSPFSINHDAGYIDCRRLKRARRRFGH